MESARVARRPKLQASLDDDELLSLRIPSSGHRGVLSPSRFCFLPTLQEQSQDRVEQDRESTRHMQSRHQRSARRALEVSESIALDRNLSDEEAQRTILSDLSLDFLNRLRIDFARHGNALNVMQFTDTILRNLAISSADATFVSDPLNSARVAVSWDEKDSERARATAIVKLFERINVHDEARITWDQVSNFLVEQGLAAGVDHSVDSVKMYAPSSVTDSSKHEGAIENLVYLEPIDTIVCLTRDSRRFRLYNPKRFTEKSEVVGHRGSVTGCCYVDDISQIATCSADRTICLWDAGTLGLRNRMAAKDVQLCLGFDTSSKNLFSGGIDGTLNRYDLQTMSLADARKGMHKGAINEVLMVQDLNLLASASSDGNIIMWDTSSMKPKKTFRAHRKGVYSMSYSMDHHCLLSSGLDQEALVWNPYVVSMPIFRLKGHTHSLCGVTVVPGTPQIITADIAGNFRLWDMRTFRCAQTFSEHRGEYNQMGDLKCFCAVPTHNRLVAGGLRVIMFDYKNEGSVEQRVTDSEGVTDALYNPRSGVFHIVTQKSLKSWSAESGLLFRVHQDVAKHEITAACLADSGRKVYIGDSSGGVAAHGLADGSLLTEFEGHRADISCLATLKGTSRLVSASWDGVVKVHSDEGSRSPKMTAEFKNHCDSVACIRTCSELALLATGGTDTKVYVYDMKTFKLEAELNRFRHSIECVDFLPRRCLLAVADQGGLVSLWRTPPHGNKWTCTYHFKNCAGSVLGLVSPLQATPVSALCFVPSGSSESARLFTADAKGRLRCWDLSVFFQHHQIDEVNIEALQEMRGGRRGAARGRSASNSHGTQHHACVESGIETARAPLPALVAPTVASAATEGGTFLTSVGFDEGVATSLTATARGNRLAATQREATVAPGSLEVKLLFECDGHAEAVVSLNFISHPPALVSCGLDRRVATWSLQLESYGVLLQRQTEGSFCFPFDPCQRAEREYRNTEEVMRSLSLKPTEKAKALEAKSTLRAALSTPRERPNNRAKMKQWELTAERVLEDAEAEEGDFRILFEHLEEARKSADGGEGLKAGFVYDRLVRDGLAKQAGCVRRRGRPLSQNEVGAAHRLANAMKSCGGDEYGTFAAMARSLALPAVHAT